MLCRSQSLVWAFAFELCVVSNASAELAVDISESSPATIEAPMRIGVPSLVTEIRIRNSAARSGIAQTYRASPTLIRQSDGLAVPALWKQLNPPLGDTKTVVSGSELVLQLSAELAEPGTYETWIDTTPAEGDVPGKDHRIHAIITRESEAVAADFLTDPKPVRMVYRPWAGESRVLMTLQNTTTKTVEFSPPTVIGFSDIGPAGTVSMNSSTPPRVDIGDCKSPLGPGARCAINLILAGPPPPGQYAVDLGVAGRGGGWSQRTAQVSSRLPYMVAFLVTTLGAAAGWYVQSWRTSGRRALNGLISLSALRGRTRRIASSDECIGPGVDAQPIFDAIDAAEAHCRNGADIAADLELISERVDRLTSATAVEAALKKLSAQAQLILSRLRAAVLASVNDSDTDGPAFQRIRQALTKNLMALPELDDALRQSRSTLKALDRLSEIQGLGESKQPLDAAREALGNAVSEATAALPANTADEAAVAKRTDALADARRSAEAAARAASASAAAALRQAADEALCAQGAPEEARARGKTALDRLGQIRSNGDLGAQVSAIADAWATFAAAGKDVASFERRTGLEGWEGPGGVANTATGAPSLDVPADLWLPLGRGHGLETLSRARAVNEWTTNGLILVGIGCAGVALIASNESWGSWVDVITLFLGGLGSRVVIGAVGAATNSPAG